MHTELQILVNRLPASLLCEVYLYSDHQQLNRGDVVAFYSFDEKGELIVTQRVWEAGKNMVEGIKPTMIVREDILRSLASAFTEYGRKNGVEAKSESFTKGELIATKQHLADMRSIVFEKPIIEGRPEVKNG